MKLSIMFHLDATEEIIIWFWLNVLQEFHFNENKLLGCNQSIPRVSPGASLCASTCIQCTTTQKTLSTKQRWPGCSTCRQGSIQVIGIYIGHKTSKHLNYVAEGLNFDVRYRISKKKYFWKNIKYKLKHLNK